MMGPEPTQDSAGAKTSRREVLAGAAAAAMLGALPAGGAVARTSFRELDFASAGEAALAIRRLEVSSAELTQRMLDRIARFNPKLNAIVNVLAEQAMAEARARDKARDERGPLHGVPIVIKDCFEIAGVPDTAGIEQFKNYRPKSDAPVVQRLRAAGAVILGNTNVPFFLTDWQSFNAIYGTTNNPWDLSRTPGGSSGGSAAALAAGLGYLSPGSDLSGSIRIPASFCGVYGHKPSLNVVPYARAFPNPQGAPELPQRLTVAGALARSAADLRLAMQVLGGPDGDEAIAYRWQMPAPRAKRLKDYRVRFVLDDPACPVDAPVKKVMARAIDALRTAGVAMSEGWPPGVDPRSQYETYLYLMYSSLPAPPGINAEALKPLAARDDGSYASIFAQTLLDTHRAWIDHEREQVAARTAWQAAFDDCDVFLAPACFVAAFPEDEAGSAATRRLMTSAGQRPYLDLMFWNTFATLAGLPSTAAPIGRDEQGLPVGLQIVGPYLEDATPIDFAERMAEVVAGFVPPPNFI